MVEICEKVDLHVSPNVKKDELIRRVAKELLENPEDILYGLNKFELRLIDEFVKAGPNHYATCKPRKMPYKLQKYALVLTYMDEANDQWKLLMPDCVREAFADYYEDYLEFAEKGINPLLAAAMLPCICGVMEGITPPLALGMYAGMSLAGSDFRKTVLNDLWWVALQYIMEVIILLGLLPIMGV